MKRTWYALTHLGAEEALQAELADYDITCDVKSGGCKFTATEKDVAKLLYHIQTATRLLLAVDEGDFEKLNPSTAVDIIGTGTFRVSVDCIIPQELSSTELAAALGAKVDGSVNLENPDIVLYCQIGPQSLLGIDIAGDLSKRYYRVFSNSRSVKGTLAAAILYLDDDIGGLLDPFGNTGEIPIEAAIRSTHTSPLRYKKHERIAVLDDLRKDAFVDEEEETEHQIWCVDDQLGNLRSCKKNAKLAGVEKSMQFSKLDPEWMDVKFGEGEITRIVTIPPPVTQRNPEDTHLKELCYQAEYVLKDGGSLTVACVTQDTVEAMIRYAKEYKFTLTKEIVMYSGQLPVHVMRYEL